jgi:hypothetical protein
MRLPGLLFLTGSTSGLPLPVESSVQVQGATACRHRAFG